MAKKKKAVDPRGRDPRVKFSTEPIKPAPEVGYPAADENYVSPEDKYYEEAPLLNQAGEPFNPDVDKPGTAVIPDKPLTSFELVNQPEVEKQEKLVASRLSGRTPKERTSELTPDQVMQGLAENNVNVGEIKGVNDRHTEALTEYAKQNKAQEMLRKVQEYASMFEGFVDKSPLDWQKERAERKRRREKNEREALSAKTGRNAIINDILIGHRSAYPDKAKLPKNPRRQDMASFGPGALPAEEKDRHVTPFAISNYKTYLEDRYKSFMGRRQATKNIYGAEATATAFKLHQAKAGADGVAQCGNPNCVAEQTAAIQTHDKPYLNDILLNTYATNHADELENIQKRFIDKGHQIEGTRYDENASPHMQPNHTAEECPYVIPGTKTPLAISDPISGQSSMCTNHAGPHKVDSNGEPFQSDWFQTPPGLTMPAKLEDGSKGMIQIPYPGLRDFLTSEEYTRPGGIEDKIIARKMLMAHAASKPEFKEFFDKNDSRPIDSNSKLMKVAKVWLGDNSKFKSKVIDRKIPLKSTVTKKQEYEIDEETGDYKLDPKTGKKVRTMVAQPLYSLAGKSSFRREGDDTGLGFYEAGDERLHAAAEKAVAALVDAGLRHFREQKNLPNDIADILAHSKHVQKRGEKAQERIARGKTAFETIADQFLDIHKNMEAANTLSRSLGQISRAKKALTPRGAGFVSEGRERGSGQDRMADNMVKAGDMIADIAGTVTGDTRSFVPPAASGGNRRFSSGVPNSMPADQPRTDPNLVEEEPEPPLKNYSTTGAPVAPAPTVKTPEETEADIRAYSAKKKAQRKAAKGTTPPDVTLQ